MYYIIALLKIYEYDLFIAMRYKLLKSMMTSIDFNALNDALRNTNEFISSVLANS